MTPQQPVDNCEAQCAGEVFQMSEDGMTELDRRVAEEWEKLKELGNTPLGLGASRELVERVASEFEQSLSAEDFDLLLLRSKVLGNFGISAAYQLHTRVLLRLLAAAGK